MLPSERRLFVQTHRTCVFGYGRRSDGPAMSIVYYVPDDNGDLLVATMGDRAKAKAVTRNGKVSLCILDETWPFAYLQVYCDAVIDDDDETLIDVMMAVAKGQSMCRDAGSSRNARSLSHSSQAQVSGVLTDQSSGSRAGRAILSDNRSRVICAIPAIAPTVSCSGATSAITRSVSIPQRSRSSSAPRAADNVVPTSASSAITAATSNPAAAPASSSSAPARRDGRDCARARSRLSRNPVALTSTRYSATF
jgi:hypothetical protein